MRRTRILSSTLVVSFVLALSSPMATAKKEEPGQPGAAPAAAPELDQLYKGFLGTWKCQTMFPAGAMGPGSPEMKTTATVKFKKDLGGHWYRGTYAIKKTKAMPGFNGEFFLGYSPQTKQGISLSVDNMGGWTLETAASPTAQNLAFVGEGMMNGQKVKVKETMELRGPKEAFHKMEVDMGGGFKPMGEDVCKR